MTTTTEKKVVETTSEQLVSRAWQGKFAKLELDEYEQNIAAAIEDRWSENDKGGSLTQKDFYEVAKENNLERSVIDKVDRFKEAYAVGVHAVSADRSLKRFSEDENASEYSVRARIGLDTKYEDRYRRFDSRSVAAGAGGERKIRETYGYHNPSIETEHKSFKENRARVHSLAEELLK